MSSPLATAPYAWGFAGSAIRGVNLCFGVWVLGSFAGSASVVRRATCSSSVGANPHAATGSLQPVAIGAAVEVTKPSKP